MSVIINERTCFDNDKEIIIEKNYFVHFYQIFLENIRKCSYDLLCIIDNTT